jgi:ATP-dependent helicase/nuclease subunit B
VQGAMATSPRVYWPPMRIVFDPDFEHGCWPGPLRGSPASAGEDWVGPSHFVQILESTLGLGGPCLTLRERAARLVPAIQSSEGFWSASADVDPFATARRLIEWRDTLAMGGWLGGGDEPRLAALAALTAGATPGLPDRLLAIHRALARRAPDIESVELFAPRGDFEPLWQRTLDLLEQRGTRVIETKLMAARTPAGTDLAGARAKRFQPKGDGSLRLLRATGPLAAAEEVAAWLASLGRPPDTLIVGSDPALDAALHRHGLPTTGAPHELRDGVPLQILPLVLDLGWTPQDPQRAYELLSLRSSPVPGEVRWGLREALGEWPAVDSDAWRAALTAGLAAIEDSDRRERVKRRLNVLWDARVSRTGDYPVAEVLRRVGMLRSWLVGRIAVAGVDSAAWGAAASQCESLLGLVQHSGLVNLSAAQLRHLIIEATESAGGDSPFPPQAGMPQVGTPGGVAGPMPVVVWWRFDDASAPGITRLPLTRAERAGLEGLGVVLPDPGHAAAAQARRWRRPLDQAGEALLLVCPEKDVAGGDLHPHPLWDDLVSRVDAKNTRRVAEDALLRASLAGVVPQSRRALLLLPTPQREWSVPAGRIERREKESPSSVQTLLGCPLQWALQYPGRLATPDSAQVDDSTSSRQLGELLHAIMNRLFAGPTRGPDEAALEAGAIFDREGTRLVAALFLPGTDSQREHIRRVATRTAHTLYGLMTTAGLKVLATEQERTGQAFGTTFVGRVDLVLGEPSRILDLKWGGAGRKRWALKEGTALQLAAYAFLERQGSGPFPPVGYFVMDSQRLLTTQPDAFDGAEPVNGPSPEETWRVVEATHAVEWHTVADGRISARGVVTTDDEKPPKEASAKNGRLVVPPACQWCDYGALCGRAFKEDA